MFYPSFLINTYLPFYYFSKSISRKGRALSWNFTKKKDWTGSSNLEINTNFFTCTTLGKVVEKNIDFEFLGLFKHMSKLSAVRKVPETQLFQELGSFETLGSKLSHGTS